MGVGVGGVTKGVGWVIMSTALGRPRPPRSPSLSRAVRGKTMGGKGSRHERPEVLSSQHLGQPAPSTREDSAQHPGEGRTQRSTRGLEGRTEHSTRVRTQHSSREDSVQHPAPC